MEPLNDLPAYLLELAFKEDATVAELYTLGCAFAVFWMVFFSIARPTLHRLTKDSPWLRAACERDYERFGKEQMKEWGVEATKEEALDEMVKGWAWNQPIMFQHLVGGLLCVPSVFGWPAMTSSRSSSLAALGILCELGYEIQDTVEMLLKRLFKGAKEVPNVMLLFVFMHHSLTSVLGIPMLLHYRTLLPLHCLCFDLQIVAASVVLTEYGRMLDLSKSRDLTQFKVINFLMLVLMAWTRMLHWTYCCVQIIMTWYHDKAWTFMAVGAAPLIGFTFFNAFICVIPMYKRWRKFLHKSAEHAALPADVSEKDRRKSLANLEKIASDIVMEEAIDLNIEDRVRLFLEESIDRNRRNKLVRTQTAPPLRKKAYRSTRLIRGFSVPNHDIWKEE